LIALAAALALLAGAAGAGVVVDKDVPARMRDGVVLRADVYRPEAPGRFPALLQRTPYSKNPADADEDFRTLAALGFVVVVQDTRGRYTSDGEARPHDEAEDGYDTIAWVSGLPQVDGRVGMFGGSYLATTQLLAATLQPPALVALFPASSYASRYDMVFQGGAFYLRDGLGWNLGQSLDVRRRVLTPDAPRDASLELDAEQRKLLRERWLWHVPLKTLDVLELRRFAPGYFRMLDHPSFDDYWRSFDIESRHARFQVPAFHLTGWYDTLLTGTLRNFSGLRRNAGSERARRFQRLVVGPWTHARPTLASRRVADVDFGPEAGMDAEQLLRRWFGYWLQGGDSGIVDGTPVRLFVMGENRWRDEPEWPLARARATAYYLRAGGALAPEAPAEEPADRYVYDPADPVPTGDSGGYSRAPTDQRAVEARRDVLVYTTAALERELEVTGPIVLELWAASSAPDTDFTARLVDVHPDGTPRALSDGILRARYRNGKTAPELLTPGRPVPLSIDVGATSNLFRAGHRIRLEVSSSNFPRFDRNPNTGGVFGEDAELRRTEQTIYHDARRPSHLLLPVVPRQ
jgi:putative CocE/NonD family hydrolase